MVREDAEGWTHDGRRQEVVSCSVGREAQTAGRTEPTAARLGELHRQEDLEGVRPASCLGCPWKTVL